MQQRLQSLVDSKVDAIVLIFPVPAILAKQLAAAKAAGIPVVSAGFVADKTPLIQAQYVGDQNKMSTLLTERMTKDFPEGGDFGVINLPGYLGVDQRVNTFKKEMSTKDKVVAQQDVPQADVFGGTTKAAIDILNANPKLTAFFSCCDFGGQAIAPALQQTKRDVPVYSFYAIPSVLDLVRAGKVVVAESDEAKTGAMAVGALAAHWADGKPFDAAAMLQKYPLQYMVVDRSNAPSAGKEVYPLDQALAPMIADWKSAYGL
jgi:ABC-type sugar transport system substrate-binding protein